MKHSIKNIILGWWRWLTHWNRPDWAIERIKICDACEYKKHGACSICLCKIPQKCLVKEEICHAGKWKDE